MEDDPNAEIWAHIEPESSRRLLLSALSAFSAHGFHAATTREIGEGAGMSSAAVYVHYRSKADLLFEISRIGHQDSFDTTTGAVDGDGGADADATARLHAFMLAFARWHCENHTLARVLQYEWTSLQGEQHRAIAQIRERHERFARALFAAGVAEGAFDVPDLKGTTRAALSLSIDLSRWYRPSAEHPPEAVAALYAELVLRMVGAGG